MGETVPLAAAFVLSNEAGEARHEFEVDREEAARYGMSTMMVNEVVSAGLGGVDVTTTVEGRERYPIQIRYHRDVRERIDELGSLARPNEELKQSYARELKTLGNLQQHAQEEANSG